MAATAPSAVSACLVVLASLTVRLGDEAGMPDGRGVVAVFGE